MGSLDWTVLLPYRWLYVHGLGVTLSIAAESLVVSLLLGFVLSLLSVSRLGVLRAIAVAYVWLFRAIPLFVFLLWTYYGLSLLVHINLSPIQAGLLCLGMQYAAFQSEVFRGGLRAVSHGQLEAASSVGLSKVQTYMSIVIPQLLRLVLPASGNNFVSIVKDTSLVALIGVMEITRYTDLAIAETYRVFEFYTALAVIYLIVVLLLSGAVTQLERHFAIPGA
jgi:His/Glu/Gln/Arg/opine family amino acid ABC transporter permease subunit